MKRGRPPKENPKKAHTFRLSEFESNIIRYFLKRFRLYEKERGLK